MKPLYLRTGLRLAAVILAVLLLISACATAATPPTTGENPGAEPSFTQAATENGYLSTATVEASGGEGPEIRATPLPAIPEQRLLVLESPMKLRTGDSDVVRLTLEVDPEGNLTPTAEIGGHDVQGSTVFIPNLYATHNVLAEARLEILGLQVQPASETSQSLLPGERLTFYWNVRAQEVGSYRGTVWLALRFLPKDGGQETRKTISAQVIQIEAVNFMGFGGAPARLIGIAGTLLGSVLGLDNVFSWVWKQVRQRRAKRKSARRR